MCDKSVTIELHYCEKSQMRQKVRILIEKDAVFHPTQHAQIDFLKFKIDLAIRIVGLSWIWYKNGALVVILFYSYSMRNHSSTAE